MKAPDGLGPKAVRGAAYTALSQATKIALTAASTVIVARLLGPADFGLVAMASPVIGFLLIFQDLGLNQAVIQRDAISDEQLNAVFWINIASSATAAAVMIGASPAIGLFYGDPRAGYITAAFSINVLLGGTILQHGALLNRQLKFGWLGAIDVSVAAIGFIATVTFAYFVRSFWALWIGALASTITNILFLWLCVSWRPNLRFKLENARGLIGFGANVTVYNVINFMVRNLDNILIARVWGEYQLGLYDRSYKLMMFPLQSVNAPLARIMIPVLSRLQHDPERYRSSFLTAIRVLLLLTMPGIAVAVAVSDRLVDVLLGNQWASASPIFFWLSLAAFPQALSNTMGWLFISCGRTRALKYWGLFAGAITISAFGVGLIAGAVGVARAYAIAVTLLSPILYWWAPRGTPVHTSDLFVVIIQPLMAAAASIAAIALISAHTYMNTPLLLLAGLVISYIFAMVSQLTTRAGRRALRRVVDLIRPSMPRLRSKLENQTGGW